MVKIETILTVQHQWTKTTTDYLRWATLFSKNGPITASFSSYNAVDIKQMFHMKVYHLRWATFFLKKWANHGLFFVFTMQLTLNKCFIWKFTNDLIWTADLCCQKQLLYQLSHNHCPMRSNLLHWDFKIGIKASFVFK